jgi:hypothetical protein
MNHAHPDDAAFLNSIALSSTYLRRYCDRCKKQRHAVVVGGIEAGSGGGRDIRFCRPCVAAVLADARALAGNGDHVPALPAYY